MQTETALLNQGLLELAQDTSVGVRCCERMVERLGRLTGVRYAFVGLVRSGTGQAIDTIATYADGAIVDNMSYDLSGTPCAHVVGQTMCIYPLNVCASFPEDLLLQQMAVQGYLGAPIFDTEGRGIGLLVLLDDKTFVDTPERRTLVQIHAARAGAEIDRMRYEQRLKDLSNSLEQAVARRTAELEEANKQLSLFAYSVSHDLRVPLRHIMGCCELAQQTGAVQSDPEASGFLDKALNSGRQMGAMMEALLAMANNTSAPMHCDWIELKDVLQEVVSQVDPDTQARAAVAIEAEGRVWADRTLLRVALQNLIGNAFKYSARQPSPRIRIRAHTDGDGDAISVEDNGIGFDMRHANKLFGVFQRLHSPKDFAGHGIGLANAAAIARRHGGQIDFFSQPGAGARFTLRLPRPRQAETVSV